MWLHMDLVERLLIVRFHKRHPRIYFCETKNLIPTTLKDRMVYANAGSITYWRVSRHKERTIFCSKPIINYVLFWCCVFFALTCYSNGIYYALILRTVLSVTLVMWKKCDPLAASKIYELEVIRCVTLQEF